MEIPGFKIERLIAEGGMASVYLAVQQSLNRRVAVKVLKKFDRPEHAKRFLYEGRVIASLNHRNIITIHDIGVIGDRHYIAMEYLEGGSLGERIAGGMQPPDILDLLESIGGCLDFLHCRGIVHRDIKPGNILFHADGTPKLTDFGIAKQLDDDQDLTMDGSAFGSPCYLSPEQAEGRALDGRSDIYGLGIIFHEMLTGRKPYAENSHVETILAHLTHPVPVLPEAFSAYQDLLERMIAKNPDDRVASARDLLERVRELRRSGPQSRSNTAAEGSRADWLARLPAVGFQRWRMSSMPPKIALGLALFSLATGAILLPGGHETPKEAEVEIALVPIAEDSKEQASAASEQEDGAATPDEDEQPSADTPTRVAKSTEPPVSQPGPDEAPAAEESAVQPSGNDPATGPGNKSAQAIEEWLQAADRALQEYRLTTPAGDNAYAYYRKVIELDPDHEAAEAGIDGIAERYAVLARTELNNGNYPRARRHVQRGIEVRSDHEGLLALCTQLDEIERSRAARREPPPETQQGTKGSGDIAKDFQTFTRDFKRDVKKAWRDIFD